MGERQGQVPRTVGRARWVAAAVLGAAFVLWLVLFAPRLLVPAASQTSLRDVTDAAKRHELQDSRLKLQNDVRTTLLQGLGGLAVAVGAFFTYRQVQTSRRQLEHSIESSREQHELDRQGQVTERFTRAIDQLGNEHGQLDVVLGGIYSLERIARDSPDDRRTIAEVLTAYIRRHAPWRPPSKPGQPETDTPLDKPPASRALALDIQAAIMVLGRAGFTVQEADWEGDWRDRLILSGVDLRGAHLVLAHLENADLIRAHLERAVLTDAHLKGAVLCNAHLEKALLFGAHLESAFLVEAHLRGADLRSAHLQGALLMGADLDGAKLDDAHLEGAIADEQSVWPDGFDPEARGVFIAPLGAATIEDAG